LENSSNDDRKARKMCCEILHKEKKEFMAQLHNARSKRSTLETIAAVIIQTYYRGFIVRHYAANIKKKCSLRNFIHGSLINFLDKKGHTPMVTRGEHRSAHIARRTNAATVIQCVFRCFLSKNYINRCRFEYEVNRMNQEARRIQNLARRKMAKSTVERKRERTILQKRTLGALMIQSQVRMLISRRKVAIRRFKLHWLAARMIQGCFRGRNTRKCMAVYLAAQEKVKFFRGARGIQQVIRGRIGRSRANRIKLRFLYLKIFKAATKIQSMIRNFLAVIRVRKRREEEKLKDRIRSDLILAEAKKKDAQEAETLANSMDIFEQTKQGDTSNVDALYHSDIESGVSADDLVRVKNDLGDTILSQATRYNHLDIIRKCINWGYDVNHKNDLGENIISLAAGEGYMSVVTYLLSDSHRNAAAILAAMPKKEKKMKKALSQEVKPVEEVNLDEKKEGEVEENNDDSTFMTGQYDANDKSKTDGQREKESGGDESKINVEVEVNVEEQLEEDEEEDDIPAIKAHNVLNLSAEDMGTILTAAAKHPDMSYLKMIVENNYISNINEVQPLTDLTALHVACEAGHLEHVDFLIKNGASLESKDDNGQLPLHKAARISLEVMKNVLEASFSTDEISDDERKKKKQELLLLKDTDGKDCFIIASLHGQSEIVDFIKSFVDMTTRIVSDEVGWSVNDISNTLQLVKAGNISCLKNVIDEGFDSSWCPEESGITIAMVASQHGRTDIIDYFMTEVGADFSACDESGMNSLHYAAQFTRKDIVPLLLSAGDKAKESCSLSKSLITVQDKRGCTPIHYCAQYGSTLSFELLARDEMCAAALLKDGDGFTPLLTACKFKQSSKISELLGLESDAKAVDNKGNNAIWHYFVQVTEGPDFAFAVNPTVELDVIQSLYKSGCPLFNCLPNPVDRDISHISNEFVAMFGQKKKQLDIQDQATFDFLLVNLQPTDLAGVENNLSFFNMLPSFLSPIDCWVSTLSAMFFFPTMLDSNSESGNGCNKCLASLFSGNNVVDVLLRINEKSEEKDQTTEETALQSVFFNKISLLGWAIKSKNQAAVTFLLRKGLSPKAAVDDNGNNSLHWAVMYGTTKIVYTVLDTTDNVSNDVIVLEGVNNEGLTASMLGAKVGSFDNTKAVIQMGASARRALDGKYWAWLLAHTIQYETREINSQTGIYGEDDELYFPLQPNHCMI
jgi:ankyrin repeat protein